MKINFNIRLLTVLILTTGCWSKTNTTNFALEGLSNPEIKNIELKEKNGIWRGQFQENELGIKPEKIDQAAAKKVFSDRTFVLMELFANRPAPYPGFFTRTVTCKDDFIPQLREQDDEFTSMHFYVLFAGERKNFGVCTNAEAKHLALYFFAYCKKTSQFFEGKIFFPPNTDRGAIEKIGRAFTCNTI